MMTHDQLLQQAITAIQAYRVRRNLDLIHIYSADSYTFPWPVGNQPIIERIGVPLTHLVVTLASGSADSISRNPLDWHILFQGNSAAGKPVTLASLYRNSAFPQGTLASGTNETSLFTVLARAMSLAAIDETHKFSMYARERQ